MARDEATEGTDAEPADVVTEDVNLLVLENLDLAVFETAEGPIAAHAEVVAEYVKMDEEMDSETAEGAAAGRTS